MDMMKLTKGTRVEWMAEDGQYGYLGTKGTIFAVVRVEGERAYRVNTGQVTPVTIRASTLAAKGGRVVAQ